MERHCCSPLARSSSGPFRLRGGDLLVKGTSASIKKFVDAIIEETVPVSVYSLALPRKVKVVGIHRRNGLAYTVEWVGCFGPYRAVVRLKRVSAMRLARTEIRLSQKEAQSIADNLVMAGGGAAVTILKRDFDKRRANSTTATNSSSSVAAGPAPAKDTNPTLAVITMIGQHVPAPPPLLSNGDGGGGAAAAAPPLPPPPAGGGGGAGAGAGAAGAAAAAAAAAASSSAPPAPPAAAAAAAASASAAAPSPGSAILISYHDVEGDMQSALIPRCCMGLFECERGGRAWCTFNATHIHTLTIQHRATVTRPGDGSELNVVGFEVVSENGEYEVRAWEAGFCPMTDIWQWPEGGHRGRQQYRTA